SSHRALLPVDLEFEFLADEVGDALHHTLTGPLCERRYCNRPHISRIDDRAAPTRDPVRPAQCSRAEATMVRLAAFPHRPDLPSRFPSLRRSRMPESAGAFSYRLCVLPMPPSVGRDGLDQRISPSRYPQRCRFPPQCTAALWSRPDAPIVPVENRSCDRKTTGPSVAAEPAEPPAG